FFFSSRRRHTRCYRDWSSDVCSSDLGTSSPELFTYDLRSLHHRLQFRKSNFPRQVQATAIRKNKDALGRHELESFAKTLGNDLRSEERRVGTECRCERARQLWKRVRY